MNSHSAKFKLSYVVIAILLFVLYQSYNENDSLKHEIDVLNKDLYAIYEKYDEEVTGLDYKDGYELGYGDGYCEGYDDGMDQGFEFGYDEGYWDGYNEGLEEES